MLKNINSSFRLLKKTLSVLVVLLMIAGTLMGQGVPQAFKYQTVIRDYNGDVIGDTHVELKISILQGINGNIGFPTYQELHVATTNRFGLVNLNIGSGDVLIGDFPTIDWAAADHFLGVEVSINGGAFINMGMTQLLSVPYALVAQKSVEGDADADPENELQTLSQAGTDVTLSNGGGTISVADNDNDPNNELQDWNSLPNIPADILDGDDVDDADADPNNEIQDISINGHELTISDGSTLTLPNDADADPTNEIQDISINGHDITISGGSTLTLPNDADADPGNEIQDIYLDGYELRISDGSTVVLPDEVNDADSDPDNEIELPEGGIDSQVLATDGAGNYSWVDNVGGSPTSYAIGDFAQGGIVFWLDETGKHGLVCAKENTGNPVHWYAGTNGNTRAKGDGPYAGEMNTAIILAAHIALGDNGTPYAASVCAELQITEGGKTYGDWYLPSTEELRQMYLNRTIINATAVANGGTSLGSYTYWSSTESSSSKGGMFSFNIGVGGGLTKYFPKPVRAVRAF